MKKKQSETTGIQAVEVYGARVHNLKNIDIKFPRNQLVVITGLSGSGKSSLAFDTIYAEGQRRYMETFSAYSRQFLGGLERPDVDKIEGLSPVIAIEQKTTSKNPRSTVGTITEIYDFLRLLYARVADAYSYNTGEQMIKMTEEQIIDAIIQNYQSKTVTILAPIVKGRKGHYRELFEQVRKQGFAKVRVDNEILDLQPKMQVDRYKIHDIEIVIDRIVIRTDDRQRIAEAIKSAMKQAKGIIKVLDNASNEVSHYSKFLMCPTTGLSYDEPQPNSFSFNSPYGACENCDGLGYVFEVDEKLLMPDRKLSIANGGIVAIGEYRDVWTFQVLKAVLKKFGATLQTPIEKLTKETINAILYGLEEPVAVVVPYSSTVTNFNITFQGVVKMIDQQNEKRADDIDNNFNLSRCG